MREKSTPAARTRDSTSAIPEEDDVVTALLETTRQSAYRVDVSSSGETECADPRHGSLLA